MESYDNDTLKKYLKLGVPSITNNQAEAFAMISHLWLDSLSSLSDSQSQSLSKVPHLSLGSLKSISDEQAVHLSSVRHLMLLGLETINEKQAASLSRVKSLYVSEAIRSQINTYERLRDGLQPLK